MTDLNNSEFHLNLKEIYEKTRDCESQKSATSFRTNVFV